MFESAFENNRMESVLCSHIRIVHNIMHSMLFQKWTTFNHSPELTLTTHMLFQLATCILAVHIAHRIYRILV